MNQLGNRVKGYKMVRVPIYGDINTLGAVEQERSRRETRGIAGSVYITKYRPKWTLYILFMKYF